MRRARLLAAALASAAIVAYVAADRSVATTSDAADADGTDAATRVAAVSRSGGHGTFHDEGAVIYARYCAGCHGAAGDGRGPAADMLIVKPRDFTSGVFKFRSTPSGSLPTDEDLYKIVSRGVYRTSMPDWALLAERERIAVIQYLKSFSPEWQKRGPGAPIHVPEPPEFVGTPDSVARGKELYDMLECSTCHGATGRGDGPSATQLKPDVWGNPQRPFDFTKGRLKSGPTVQDVYRTFMTGLDGTAMPTFADIFGEPDGENIREGDAWHLVSFIVSLRKEPTK